MKGRPAPDFTLPDQEGRLVALSDFRGKSNVVLFFYPAADTRVCTREACAFRDAFADLRARDAVVLGVSRDGQRAQHAFAERWSLPYSLLCDTSGVVHKTYGVRTFFGLVPGRVTFVIGKDGLVHGLHRGLFDAQAHVQAALLALADQCNG